MKNGKKMYRISSKLTDFNVRMLPWFLVICIIIFFVLYVITSFDFLIAFILLFILYLLMWWFRIRKLQTVYLDVKKLKVKDAVIHFDNIINVSKVFLGPEYQIKYKKDGIVKSFIFLPKFRMPFFTHSYIKEIRQNIKGRTK